LPDSKKEIWYERLCPAGIYCAATSVISGSGIHLKRPFKEMHYQKKALSFFRDVKTSQLHLNSHHSSLLSVCYSTRRNIASLIVCLKQRSPTDSPRRNLDIICNFYVYYYTVSLYSDPSSCHRHRIADNFRLITLQQQISH
jgi:hypothetical protein